MEYLLCRSAERDDAGVRLVQTAYNYQSLALYAKLGFAAREPLSVFQGTIAPTRSFYGEVRIATDQDAENCDDLCRLVHGHDRHGELCNWIGAGTTRVVERGGEITGYATGCGYLSHAVGNTDEDIIALLADAETIVGLGVLVPSRNARLMAWCLDATAGAAVDVDDDRAVQRPAGLLAAFYRLLGAPRATTTGIDVAVLVRSIVLTTSTRSSTGISWPGMHPREIHSG